MYHVPTYLFLYWLCLDQLEFGGIVYGLHVALCIVIIASMTLHKLQENYEGLFEVH